MRRYAFIIAFLVLLVVPLAAHWMVGAASRLRESRGAAGRLVIITPHDGDIRNEFRWAFAEWHEKKYGQRVEVEYLTPGGTEFVHRQLDMSYRAIRDKHGGALPPEDQIDLGIDLVWGGGDFEFDQKLKPLGILRPVDLPAEVMSAAFPQPALAGVKLYDQTRDAAGQLLPPRWVGVCLSSFGIIYNPDVYQALGLPPPTTWSDLTDPRLAGNLSLADPTQSGSAGVAYMMVIQRAMADAELPKGSPNYEQALDAGWSKGMGQLVLIAANGRYFTDSSTQPPNDVASGDAAAGVAIDFYGRVTAEAVGPEREKFVTPAAATAITPDPVAILYGCRGQRLIWARHFVEFLLSEQGQRLWILKTGQPGGPRQRALRRAPIRQSVYADRRGWADDFNYFAEAGDFNERAAWMATFNDLPMFWAAAWLDQRDVLDNAYTAVLKVPDPARRAALIDELAAIPVTRDDVTKFIADRKKKEAAHDGDSDLWKAQQRLYWAARFAAHYRHVAQEANEIRMTKSE